VSRMLVEPGPFSTNVFGNIVHAAEVEVAAA
jgi:hypothetical protein